MERGVETAGVNSAIVPPATNRVTGRLRRLLGKLFWTLVRASWSFVVPLLRIILLVAFMGMISILGYYLLHRSLLPKALLEEPLYFDFSRSPPMARVSLLSHEKQWYYISDCLKQQQKYRSKRAATTTVGSGSREMDPDTCNASSDKTLGSEKNADSVNGMNGPGCGDSDKSSMDTLDEYSDEIEGNGIRVDSMQSSKSSSSSSGQGKHYDSNGICSRKGRKSFLRSGSRYTVDVKFGLSTSPKNMQRGKFMVTTTVFDTSGEAVARSSRPVVIPYQSALTLIVDAAVKYPMRALGMLRSAEVMDVHVPVMNDFKQQSTLSSGGIGGGGNGGSSSSSTKSPLPPPPGSSVDMASDGILLGPGPGPASDSSSSASVLSTMTSATTEYIELELSTADVDIDYSQLTVMPLLSGLAYYMYYFPYLSFLLGVTCFTCLQLAVVMLFMVVKYVSFVLFQADDAMATGDDATTNAANPADIAAMRQQRGFGVGVSGGGLPSGGSTAFRYRNQPTSNRQQQQQRTGTDFNLAPSAATQRAASSLRTGTGTDRDRATLGSNNPNARNINASNLRTSTAATGRPLTSDDYTGRTESALGQGPLDDEEEAIMLRTERLRREEESRRRRLRRRQQMLSANLEQ